jgi:hypothetical protein
MLMTIPPFLMFKPGRLSFLFYLFNTRVPIPFLRSLAFPGCCKIVSTKVP